MSGWFNVVPESELLPGQAKLVDFDSVMIAVFNLEGEYHAIEDVCTHDGSPMLGCGLEPEHVINGTEIICPRHGARFCIKTGNALNPAYEAITTFPVRIENGMIQVTDDRWD
jgi:3-phenylpropionate/trans-cinnamate dioxygenase ferredoxin component